MTDELAKQLKDAGFPGSAEWFRVNQFAPSLSNRDYEDVGLSELIEACGEEFSILRQDDGWEAVGGFCWDDSTPRKPIPDRPIVTKGSTPEEAVAKLWLALNKPTT